jgi:hypothetical protein
MGIIQQQLIMRDFALFVIQGIRNNITSKDYTGYGPSNNTGMTAASLYYEWDGRTLLIKTRRPDSLKALEVGRPPTENNEGGVLRGQILKWVQQRGITDPNTSQESIAYLISRKIHREGTIIWRKFGKVGGNTGVVTDFINDDAIDKLVSELGTFVYSEINKLYTVK